MQENRADVITLILGFASFFCFSCSSNKGPVRPTAGPAIPVSVAQVVSKDVPLQVHAIGTMEAYSTVSIRSMVSGEVIKVHFEEGQKVTKGSLLFEIDPRPFAAALQSSEANLARDNAALMESNANLARDTAQDGNASLEKTIRLDGRKGICHEGTGGPDENQCDSR